MSGEGDGHLRERRRSSRIRVELLTLVEVLGPVDHGEMSPPLAQVYESVQPALQDLVGTFDTYVIAELSANGAFLVGAPLPLLSRVRFSFFLPERGEIEAVGWVMYRRTAPCTITRWDGAVELPAGIGVLFESVPVEARVALADWANREGG